jgi:AcrR family transcriptional regulator
MAVTTTSQGDLRTRKKVAAMRRVQEAALELFEQRGFDAVSIEEIAARAEVGPTTIYRNFGTEERLVLWDEYDPMLLEALAAALVRHDVVTAMRRALASSVAGIYRQDRERILRRARLIRATPPVVHAAAIDLRLLRGAIAALLLRSKRARDDLAARVLAGAAVAAMEAGIDRWLDGEGRESLARSLDAAFRRLRALA